MLKQKHKFYVINERRRTPMMNARLNDLIYDLNFKLLLKEDQRPSK